MEIQENEIHLWICRDEEIRDDALLEKYHTQLNEAEGEQQARFVFEKHRHQYLITRAMVRNVLSLYENSINPEQWGFDKNEYGKPAINNNGLTIPIRFNLSHTEGMIVLAITLEHEVGVDVEYLLRKGKTIDIADRYFSPVETEELLSLPQGKQRERFFDLWTLKEAYIKACGMGLSIPLDHFTFQFSHDAGIDISFHPSRLDDPEKWQFWQMPVDNEHKVSLALQTENNRRSRAISFYQVTPIHGFEELTLNISRQSSAIESR